MYLDCGHLQKNKNIGLNKIKIDSKQLLTNNLQEANKAGEINVFFISLTFVYFHVIFVYYFL